MLNPIDTNTSNKIFSIPVLHLFAMFFVSRRCQNPNENLVIDDALIRCWQSPKYVLWLPYVIVAMSNGNLRSQTHCVIGQTTALIYLNNQIKKLGSFQWSLVSEIKVNWGRTFRKFSCRLGHTSRCYSTKALDVRASMMKRYRL